MRSLMLQPGLALRPLRTVGTAGRPDDALVPESSCLQDGERRRSSRSMPEAATLALGLQRSVAVKTNFV